MSKKNVYLWSKDVGIANGRLVPILWFTAKTYYEEFGKNSKDWQWHDPFIHYQSYEDILSYCEKNPPSVFGLSVYVWNQSEAHQLAKELKHRFPNCLIVYGGPQNDIKYSKDFFFKHPWVDMVLPSDVYGEPILTQILDEFDSLNPGNIPEVYYQKKGILFKSRYEFKKREHKWPKNIFNNHQEYFNFNTANSMIVYETSRGCPYSCIYCDWGGGTFTKVVKKPIETVRAELEFIASNKIEYLYLSDANFGIFKEDIDIIKYVVELKNKYGYPKIVSVESAKNHLERVIEIQEILISNGLVPFYRISVQNPHEEIKNNIQRVDIPFKKVLKETLKLKEKYDAPILVEVILGLPGDNYQKNLDAIDLFDHPQIKGYRTHIWSLLPEAPAYDPIVREKFKIQTKRFEVNTHPFVLKESHRSDEGVFTMADTSLKSEHVISTYSYSKHEWCDMVAINMISLIAKTTGVRFFTDYLKHKHKVKASQFYDIIYTHFIKKKQFSNQELNKKMGGVVDFLREIVDRDDKDKMLFDLDPAFPFYLAPHVYMTFVVMLYAKDFFKDVSEYFSVLYNDKRITDLGTYLANIMIDIDYHPINKRKFYTNYNWHSYFNENKKLLKRNYEYIILDEKVKMVGTSDFEDSDYYLETDQNQKIKQFFYHRAASPARQKYALEIVETQLERKKK